MLVLGRRAGGQSYPYTWLWAAWSYQVQAVLPRHLPAWSYRLQTSLPLQLAMGCLVLPGTANPASTPGSGMPSPTRYRQYLPLHLAMGSWVLPGTDSTVLPLQLALGCIVLAGTANPASAPGSGLPDPTRHRQSYAYIWLRAEPYTLSWTP